MGRSIAKTLVFAALLAAACLLAGCGGGGGSKKQLTISFQAPASGPLKARANQMREAAQLALDAIGGDTSSTKLTLVSGYDPKAIATINALAPTAVSGTRQLTVNLNPPLRRETDPLGKLHPHPFAAPEVWLLPPANLAAAATRSYAASGATDSTAAVTDSPLRPGTPNGLYVTDGLSADSYPPAGREFFEKYAKQYGQAPDRYAIYGYEAIGLLVDAIDRLEDAGKPVTQAAVARSALSIRDRFSPVGHYDVLPSGQTTLYLFQARGANAPTGPASLVEALR